MPYNIFIALVVFVSVMAFTPGPNNIMLTASGVNFGFARTVPHLLGVTVGFLVLVTACAIGLAVVFSAVPVVQRALKFIGAAYMCWLAWKVANAKPSGDAGDPVSRPLTFIQAAAFQWVNPKALLSALSSIAIYIRPGHEQFDLPVVLGVFGICTFAATSTWTGFGVALSRLLRDPLHARIFNAVMAILLVASIVPMVM